MDDFDVIAGIDAKLMPLLERVLPTSCLAGCIVPVAEGRPPSRLLRCNLTCASGRHSLRNPVRTRVAIPAADPPDHASRA